MKTDLEITAGPASALTKGRSAGNRHDGRRAFTLTELVVALAALMLLGSMSLTAMSGSKSSSQAVTCVDNVQQLARAWQLYAVDNLGVLPGNGDEGNQGATDPQWCKGVLSYSADNADNTNTLNFTYHNSTQGFNGGQLSPYLSHNPSLFKCPSDPVMIFEGAQKYPRCRSVSMNCYTDGATTATMRWNANTWDGVTANVMYQTAQIVNPGPAGIWVFHDERPDSINGGFFALDIADSDVVNMPASYHSGGAANAYADGHAEIHLWKTAPFNRQDVNSPGWTTAWTGAVYTNNVDRAWLQSHSAQFGGGFFGPTP